MSEQRTCKSFVTVAALHSPFGGAMRHMLSSRTGADELYVQSVSSVNRPDGLDALEVIHAGRLSRPTSACIRSELKRTT